MDDANIFDSDKAILSCKEDKLNRCNYAKTLSESIINYREKDSLVVGILGKWGYGKTSILNMVIENIIKFTKDDDNPPIIIQFNPWLFSNQNQLIKKFFDEMSIKINDDEIKESLKSYVNKLIPPIIGLASVIDGSRTQALLKTAEYIENRSSEEESLESIKNDLNDLICKKNQKIIVFIDDIDRLTDFEIRQTFQMVKLLADFQNTLYVLSFDRKVVINALDRAQKGFAEEYLEKIVQIPFEVPKIHKNDIELLLFSQINEVIGEYEGTFDQVYWWNLYYSGLKYFFNSLRDVKRYINALKFNFNIIKDEINPADFLAISAIQVFFPEIYQKIWENKDLFAGVFDDNGRNFQAKQKYEQNICNDIIILASPVQEPLKELLCYIFPRLSAVYSGSPNYGKEWLSTWRKDLRICSPDKFEIYFRLSIHDGEIFQSEINNLLASTNDPQKLNELFLEFNENGKIIPLLERLEDYTQDIPEMDIETVITVLMDIADLFPEAKKGMFDLETNMKVSRIIHQLIRRVSSNDQRFIIIKNAIENSKNSIYILCSKIAIEDQVQAKYGLADHPDPEDRWMVNSEQLEELENSCCIKLHEWVEDGRLQEHEKLVEILFDWIRWEPEETKSFVNNMIRSEKGLLNFITKFRHQSSRHTFNDKVSQTFWTLSTDNISVFVDLKEIEPRIREIRESPTFNDLDENTKDAIKLFLDNISTI